MSAEFIQDSSAPAELLLFLSLTDRHVLKHINFTVPYSFEHSFITKNIYLSLICIAA